MSFFAKLKRRNVFRSALAYAVAAWLLVEVMELVTETFGAPPWVLQVFVSLAVIGVVPVVLFSWLYEITPEGIRREGTGKVDHSHDTTRKLNLAIVVMLAIAIGLFATQQFTGQPDTAVVTSTAAVGQAPVPQDDDAPPDAAGQVDAVPMVAALPFTSVSLDGESDFFAVGVHDDLLTQLAQLQSMRVISRTSVLEYKGTSKNIRDIGKELGADIILEGGVQAAGQRIRINAQLIDARTDEHLWAQTYDREMSAHNIFDVQREISGAIAKALNTTLTLQDDEQLRVIPTENMAAYRAWHRALEIRNRHRDLGWDAEYIAALRETIELDPEFVRPRAELVGAISLDAVGMVEIDQEIAARAERELEAIRGIAPDSAEYLIAQTYYIYYVLRDYDHAYEVVSLALARNPSDIQVLELKSWIERRQLKMEQREATLRELIRLDPKNDGRVDQLLTNTLLIHRYDELAEGLAQTSVSTLRIDWYRALIQLRSDGDFERYLQAVEVIYQRDPEALAFDLALALLLSQRLDEARTFQDEFDPDDLSTNFSARGLDGLLIYWVMGEQDKLQHYAQASREFIDSRRDSEGNILNIRDFLHLALVDAVDGNAEAALQGIDAWEAVNMEDPAQLLFRASQGCWALGIAGIADRAVQCLRHYLVAPSVVLPFFDPYLPFFDPVREAPEFVALMADIEAGKFD